MMSTSSPKYGHWWMQWVIAGLIAMAATYTGSRVKLGSAEVRPKYTKENAPQRTVWKVRDDVSKNDLVSVFQARNGELLWITGTGGAILYSQDRETWKLQESRTRSTLFSIFGTRDGSRLWAVGSQGAILYSRDGSSWGPQRGAGYETLLSITGTEDGGSLWAAGEAGAILHWTEGGGWRAQISGTSRILRSVFAAGDGRSVWAAGDGGAILHTSDGEHWTPQASGTTQDLHCVFGAPDGSSLWAVGGGGAIVHSRDGEHWSGRAALTPATLRSGFAAGDGKSLWVVGDNGTVLHSADGEHWYAQSDATSQDLDGVTGTRDGRLMWAVGVSGAMVRGELTGERDPFLSEASVEGESLKLTFECPDGPRGGSVEVTAESGQIPRTRGGPKPIGSLQISQACKLGELSFDPQGLGLTSGANVHFTALVKAAAVQRYTVDGVYRTWFRPARYILLGAGIAFSLFVGLFRWRAQELPRARLEARVDALGPKLETADYRNVQTILAQRERDAEALFLKNVNAVFVVRSFELRHVRFFENFSYEFAPRVNVLLGKNGYGKTLLFRALAALIQCDLENGAGLFPPEGEAAEGPDAPRVTLLMDCNGEPSETTRDAVYFTKTAGKVPLLAIPDARFVNRNIRTLSPSSIAASELSRTGARQFLTQEPFDATVVDLLVKLCQEYDRSGSLNRPIFRLITEVVRELTDDENFAFHSINHVGSSGYEILVTTAGSQSTPLPIQAASQGTLSILAIVGLIFSFLRSLRPKVSDKAIFEAAGVVLIDEIDAHLHPSWQQKLMPILTRRFPNVQFIVSAHSPLLVAGCDRNEVAVLRRNRETDRFYVEMLQQDFLGAKPEDLYKLVFEVGDMDHLYLEYAAKAASGATERVTGEIERIENLAKWTPEQEARLGALVREQRLMKRAAEVREERLEAVAANARIAALQSEIERLKEELRKRGA
ncbi:MAG: AAA family ATPase [Acidobacteriia bacterium]|nr:AAA family ATPase [Terriglobia bacterium]